MKTRLTVLIVEADPIARHDITRWCLRNGYATSAVSHPRQALAAASCHGYAAAIVNQSLPEIDGVDLSNKLKGLVANLKVLLLSSDPNGINRSEALKAGADAFLHLPCPLEQIVAKLDAILCQRKPQRIEKQRKPHISSRVFQSIGYPSKRKVPL